MEFDIKSIKWASLAGAVCVTVTLLSVSVFDIKLDLKLIARAVNNTINNVENKIIQQYDKELPNQIKLQIASALSERSFGIDKLNKRVDHVENLEGTYTNRVQSFVKTIGKYQKNASVTLDRLISLDSKLEQAGYYTKVHELNVYAVVDNNLTYSGLVLSRGSEFYVIPHNRPDSVVKQQGVLVGIPYRDMKVKLKQMSTLAAINSTIADYIDHNTFKYFESNSTHVSTKDINGAQIKAKWEEDPLFCSIMYNNQDHFWTFMYVLTFELERACVETDMFTKESTIF